MTVVAVGGSSVTPVGGDDADLVPLSALQHYLFCPRQCALIHVERLWAENVLTAEGRILHEQSDKPGQASRGERRIVQGMPIRSRALGVAGVADVVELTRAGERWRPYPIEYKRGRPKAHRADEVQLCAQALCLEEMFCDATCPRVRSSTARPGGARQWPSTRSCARSPDGSPKRRGR